MKKGYKVIAVTLSMVLALTGIVGEASVNSQAKAKIKLNKKKVTLTVGKSVKLKLKGTGQKAKWSSSKESVAMVSSTGKVIAVSVGKAKITAKIKKKKYSCSVTVKRKATDSEVFYTAIPTKTPVVTKVPATTAPAGKTNAPSNTNNPAGTDKPNGSNAPGKTETPEVTETPVKTEEPEETILPVKPRVVYQFVGKVTGWGGPDTYPSSENHEQGDGESNSVNESLTNIKARIGSYKCGLELMNKYNDFFTGASNELSQIIKGMTDPVIRVTLENGGTASAYNWYDELKCPSGEEVSLTKEFLRNEYVGLFGNDDTITKVEIYDRAATVVEPEQPDETKAPVKTEEPGETEAPVKTEEPEETRTPTKTEVPEVTKTPVKTEEPEETEEPEKTEAPENPSQPDESYTPDIPVVTPGTTDVDNEVLASNMKASIQRMSNGDILLKVVNNNDVTVNHFLVTVTWKDAQGNGATCDDYGEIYPDHTVSSGYFLGNGGLYYDEINPISMNKDKIDLSKSEISIEVDQTYTEKYYFPLTSKITVTSQKTIDEYGDSQIDYEIKNNDSKDASIDLVFLYKDAQGNVIAREKGGESLKAGETVRDYIYTPYDENGDEHIDFASYEIYINGYMYDSES